MKSTMIRQTRRAAVTLLGMVAISALAQPLQAAPKKYPYTITTTVGMVNDIVQNVAGDKAKAIFTKRLAMTFPR